MYIVVDNNGNIGKLLQENKDRTKKTRGKMINKGIICQGTMGQDMPFRLKQTVGISGHCSKAQSRSMRKLVKASEASRKQWKTVEGLEVVQKEVEDLEGAGRGQKGYGK